MQKGQVLIFLLIGILIIAAVGGFLFYTNYYSQTKINSFEECVKAGNKVLLSYPGRCITKDGRNFIEQLTDEQKKKLNPPPLESTSSNRINVTSDETANWKTYTNNSLGISFKYPSDWGTPLTTNLSVYIEIDPDLREVVSACPGYAFSIARYDHLSNYSSYKPTKPGIVDKEPVQVFEQTNQYGCYEKIIFVNKPPEENYIPKLVISMTQKDKNPHVLDQILSTFKFL